MAHQAHEDYHHGMKKPLIGIAGNILVMETGSMPGLMRDYVNHDYSVSVIRAGGIPIIIPPLSDREDILSVLQHIDGLILSGGYDIAPDLYGEEPQLGLGFTMRIVDLFYIEMIQEALAMRLPMLGICKGMQAMKEKYEKGIYGKCIRYGCHGVNLIPMGTTFTLRRHSAKLYCPKCCDIYRAPDNIILDGAHFGPAFPHMFLFEYKQFDKSKEFEPFEIKAFGFKIHKGPNYRFPAHSKNKYEQETPEIE